MAGLRTASLGRRLASRGGGGRTDRFAAREIETHQSSAPRCECFAAFGKTRGMEGFCGGGLPALRQSANLDSTGCVGSEPGTDERDQRRRLFLKAARACGRSSLSVRDRARSYSKDRSAACWRLPGCLGDSSGEARGTRVRSRRNILCAARRRIPHLARIAPRLENPRRETL